MDNQNSTSKIIEDILENHIILLSKPGHGKSTSLMTVVKELKEKHPRIVIKIFDVSQVWYHRAPVKHRQRIIIGQPWQNIDDCVYEIGSLTEEQRRVFVGIVVKQDYDLRYDLKIPNGELRLPKIVYVFEEANCYFGSYALRKNDDITPALRDFVSVGRNYGLRAFCVVTAEVGELSPTLRRRSTRLIGQIVNDYDLRMLNRKVKRLNLSFKEETIKLILDKSENEEEKLTFEGLNKEIKGLGDLGARLPKFYWVYYNGRVSEVFRIRDEVTTIPIDYVINLKIAEPQKRQRSSKEKAMIGFIIGAAIVLLFFMYFAGL